MTYTTLEQLVGNFIREPGAVGSGWTRYSQTRRRQAIAKAELWLAKHLPDDKIPRPLIKVKNDIVSVTASGFGTIAAALVPPDLLRVLEIWDDAMAGGETATFDYLPESQTHLRKNNVLGYNYYWYWGADGGINLIAPSGYGTDAQDLRYVRYPNSYDFTKNVSIAGAVSLIYSTTLLMVGAVTGWPYLVNDEISTVPSAGPPITQEAIGLVRYVPTDNSYLRIVVTSGTFKAGRTLKKTNGDGVGVNPSAPITFAQGEFGDSDSPMEGYEEIVASGAAALLMLQNHDPGWREMAAPFNEVLGQEMITDKPVPPK